MKVLFVPAPVHELCLKKALWIRSLIRYLPCDLIECYSIADIKSHLDWADVVLLDIPRYIPFCKDLIFLRDVKALKLTYYGDVWRPYKLDDVIKPDVHLVPVWELALKHRPEWTGNMFWLPASVDVWDYDLVRDVDILFWGTVGYPSSTSYPFREFIKEWLGKHVVKQIAQYDPFLSTYCVDIRGHKYVYAYLQSVPGMQSRDPNIMQATYGYYGEKLYRLISRAKICCAGPKLEFKVPVGKYFENAAYGAVTLSPDFTDRKALGFEHKENIWITDRSHFGDHLIYLLEHPNLVEQISKNACSLVMRRHTRKVRVQELYQFLCREVGRV